MIFVFTLTFGSSRTMISTDRSITNNPSLLKIPHQVPAVTTTLMHHIIVITAKW
jgi:hypothetical protein